MSKKSTNRKKCGKGLFYFSLFAAVILLDRLTKKSIIDNLDINQTMLVMKNVLNFTFVTNTGAGFGILNSFNLPLLFLGIAVSGFLLLYFDRFKTKYEKTCITLIIAGALGNVIDRIMYGHVVDFIDFNFWPAFNVADSAICVGVIGLIIYYRKK